MNKDSSLPWEYSLPYSPFSEVMLYGCESVWGMGEHVILDPLAIVALDGFVYRLVKQ